MNGDLIEMTEGVQISEVEKSLGAVKEQHSQCGYIRVTEGGLVEVGEVRKVAWESQITEDLQALARIYPR